MAHTPPDWRSTATVMDLLSHLHQTTGRLMDRVAWVTQDDQPLDVRTLAAWALAMARTTDAIRQRLGDQAAPLADSVAAVIALGHGHGNVTDAADLTARLDAVSVANDELWLAIEGADQ